MGRIKDTSIYDYDTVPSLEDYVIGTDSTDSLRTKNYRIADILALVGGGVEYLPLAGGSMSGDIDMQENELLDVGNIAFTTGGSITNINDITPSSSGITRFGADDKVPSIIWSGRYVTQVDTTFWAHSGDGGDGLAWGTTDAGASGYTILYSLDETGVPASNTDLITKEYFEDNLIQTNNGVTQLIARETEGTVSINNNTIDLNSHLVAGGTVASANSSQKTTFLAKYFCQFSTITQPVTIRLLGDTGAGDWVFFTHTVSGLTSFNIAVESEAKLSGSSSVLVNSTLLVSGDAPYVFRFLNNVDFTSDITYRLEISSSGTGSASAGISEFYLTTLNTDL